MTTRREDGGAAFAHPGENNGQTPAQSGMSLRDYFAAAALTGLIANAQSFSDKKPDKTWGEHFADQAYQQADAMLRARSLPTETA